jgi:hypothetical protein
MPFLRGRSQCSYWGVFLLKFSEVHLDEKIESKEYFCEPYWVLRRLAVVDGVVGVIVCEH